MTRSHPLLVLVATALPLALLAGCSGDDDTPPKSDAASAAPGEQVVGCRADVAVTGDADAAWKGRAKVNLRNAGDEGPGPEARYTTEDGTTSLSVFSEGPDFKPNITLSLDGVAYSSGEAPQDLTAETDGSTVEASDVALTGPDDASLSLQATFTCTKPDQG